MLRRWPSLQIDKKRLPLQAYRRLNNVTIVKRMSPDRHLFISGRRWTDFRARVESYNAFGRRKAVGGGLHSFIRIFTPVRESSKSTGPSAKNSEA